MELEKSAHKVDELIMFCIREAVLDILRDMKKEYGPNQSLKYAAAEEYVQRLLKVL